MGFERKGLRNNFAFSESKSLRKGFMNGTVSLYSFFLLVHGILIGIYSCWEFGL